MADYLALGERRGIIAAYLHEVTRHFGLFQSLDAAQVLKALAPRSGVKIAYPLEALAAQAGTSEQRTERVLDVLREHRIVRTRDAAGGSAMSCSTTPSSRSCDPGPSSVSAGATSALVVWQAWPCCWR
jgi:hypothetical protein